MAISVSQSEIACNFITDLNNEEFNKVNVPKWLESMQTKAVFISENPVFCSLISDKVLELIRQLEKQRRQEKITPTDEMLKGGGGGWVDMQWTGITFRGSSLVAILLFSPCYENEDKLRPNGPPSSRTDSSIYCQLFPGLASPI